MDEVLNYTLNLFNSDFSEFVLYPLLCVMRSCSDPCCVVAVCSNCTARSLVWHWMLHNTLTMSPRTDTATFHHVTICNKFWFLLYKGMSCLNYQIMMHKSISRILICRKKDFFIKYPFHCHSIKLHYDTCVILVFIFVFFCIWALVGPFNILL